MIPLTHVFSILSSFLYVVHASQLQHLESLLGIDRYEVPSWGEEGQLTYMSSFQDITLLSYSGQTNFTTEANGSSLIYHSNDTFINLFEIDGNTHIEKIVPFQNDGFILSGNGTVNNMDLKNQLLLNLTTLATSPILPRPISDVNCILVLDDMVYFGGNFSYNVDNETANSVIAWDSSSNSTQLLPFKGFGKNSNVNSIVQLDSENILFAGYFQNFDNSTLLSSMTNGSNINGTSSSDLLDIQLDQSVPLKLSSILGSGISQEDLLCPASSEGNGWFVANTKSSTLQFDLKNEIYPSKIRIYNSLEEDSQVSMFRLVTLPTNGIMNMTYLDPSNGQLTQCDAWCPLLSLKDLEAFSQNTTKPRSVSLNNNSTDIKWTQSYQEFSFVNDIPVQSIQLIALDSYGSNVAIKSFEVFETEFMVYANNILNEPNCNSASNYSKAVLSSDSWYSSSTDTYMETVVNSVDATPYINFYPNITYAGKYTLNLYTPGCLSDNSCSKRGIVNVTLYDEPSGEILSTKLVYQTNNEDKFDPLFTGYLTSTPLIVLSWAQALSNDDSIMVADKLGVITEFIDTKRLKSSGQFQLNGLFHYNTNNLSSSLTLTNSSINQYATENLPPYSDLFAASYNNDILVGGNFNGVAKINLTTGFLVSSAQEFGTGGSTTGMYHYSNGLLLTGSYQTNSNDQLEILTYDGSAFSSFGNLNNNVINIVNYTLDDSELLLFNNAYIFNVSSNAYITNSSTLSIAGYSAGANSNNDSLLFGSILTRTLGNLNGMVVLDPNGTITTSNIPEIPVNASAYGASYINETSAAYAVEQSTANGTHHRIMITNNNSSSHMLQSEWSYKINDILYDQTANILAIGSNGSAFLNQYDVQLMILNLTGYENIARQQLKAREFVSSMLSFNSNNSILVGGSYEVDGCKDLCLFNYQSNEWNSFFNNSVFGDIRQMQFVDDGKAILIGGALQTVNSSGIQLISLDLNSKELSSIKTGSETLLHFATIGNSTTDIIAQTESDLLHFQDNKWLSIKPDLADDSKITGFSTLSKATTKKRAEDSFILVIHGILNSKSLGNVNSMIFDADSKEWQPYFVTTNDNKIEPNNLGSFFENKNNLFLSSSQTILHGNDSNPIPVSTPTPTPTPTEVPNKSKSHKIDRGFIVLIGLALALGTIAVIGLIGALFSYFFTSHKGYEASFKASY